MPALTPNRSYPYSVPTDDNDVPGAIQALAEAVDADVQALQALVGPRPMARVRGVTAVTHDGVGSTFGDLYFELVDFNVGGAIGPLTSGHPQILLPGMWLAVATFSYMQPNGPNITAVGANLVDDDNVEIGRVSTHLFPSGSEIQRNMDVSGMMFVGPGEGSLTLRSEVRRASGGSAQTFLTRTLTLLRMTES